MLILDLIIYVSQWITLKTIKKWRKQTNIIMGHMLRKMYTYLCPKIYSLQCLYILQWDKQSLISVYIAI